MSRWSHEVRQFRIVLGAFSIVFVKFVALGFVFSILFLGLSFLQTGPRAAALRLFSVVPTIVMAAAGLIKTGIMVGMYYARRPKE